MVITHRCKHCGHTDLTGNQDSLRGNYGGYVWPRENCGRDPKHGWGKGCCPGGCTWGEPEMVPTFTLTGDVEPDIHPPGEHSGLNITPCGCESCTALYEAHAGGAS